MSTQSHPPSGTRRLWGWHARITYALRWPIIAFWIVAAVLTLAYPPPSLADGDAGGADVLASADSEAFETEL
ncbi:MAG: hypothetical protein Q4F67_17110, partial [Propionibacteriaceae bacterium]|nr:hypothetical protein [Propionibacteriaceae bacterium]